MSLLRPAFFIRSQPLRHATHLCQLVVVQNDFFQAWCGWWWWWVDETQKTITLSLAIRSIPQPTSRIGRRRQRGRVGHQVLAHRQAAQAWGWKKRKVGRF